MSTAITGTCVATSPTALGVSASSRERSEWIDHLRLAAAFAVVWLHVTAPVLLGSVPVSGMEWWIGNITNAAMRWCVPVFVMISGMLLLPRASQCSEWAFYKRRAVRIVVPTLFWTAFYLAWVAFQTGRFSPRRMLTLLVFGETYFHLWFLYMLLGLYLAAPFLGAFVAHVRRRTVVLATIIGFALVSCQSTLNATRDVWYPVFLSWVSFVPYFLAGHLLARDKSVCVPQSILLGVVVVTTAVLAPLTALLWPVLSTRTMAVTYNCFNPLVIVMSMAVFLLFRDGYTLRFSRGGRLVASAAPFMLGVYLVHPLFLELLDRAGITVAIVPGIGIPLCTAMVFLLSLGTCMALAIMPGGRRLVA